MQNQTMFMIVLIVISVGISHCHGTVCKCTCCAGNLCEPTFQGNIDVSSCSVSSCETPCQAKYPLQCTDGLGSTNYQCMSSVNAVPNWIGVFNMANRCDKGTCCCPSGQAILSRENTNNLRVQCEFVGSCLVPSLYLNDTITMPTGFSAEVLFLGNPILITLSQDSRTIQLSNPLFPQCSDTATRNGALSNATINLTLVFLLIGLIRIKQLIM